MVYMLGTGFWPFWLLLPIAVKAPTEEKVPRFPVLRRPDATVEPATSWLILNGPGAVLAEMLKSREVTTGLVKAALARTVRLLTWRPMPGLIARQEKFRGAKASAWHRPLPGLPPAESGFVSRVNPFFAFD